MDAYSALRLTSCILSIIGAVLIIFSFYAGCRGRGRQYLVFLSIADGLSAIVYLLPLVPNTWLCRVQGVMGIVFPVMSFLWTDCICIYLWMVIQNLDTSVSDSKAVFRTFVSVCFVIPVAIGAACWNAVGYDEKYASAWCWIDKNKSFAWHLLGGKVAEWLSILICAISSGFILFRLHAIQKNHNKESTDYLQNLRMRLIMVPAIFILIRLGSFLRAIIRLQKSPVLKGLQAFCDPSQGLFNGFIFVVLSKPARDACLSKVKELLHQDDAQTNEPLLAFKTDSFDSELYLVS